MAINRLRLLVFLALLISGCATQIIAPTSGPTSSLDVVVTNFAPERELTNIENVYLTLSTQDGSWGGEQLIKNDMPHYGFVIPAHKELTYIINLMQGGGGFSGSCGVQFDFTVPEKTNLTTQFSFVRANGPEIIGCKVDLLSENRLIQSYVGSSSITRYKVKFIN